MTLSLVLSLLLVLPAIQEAPRTERTLEASSGGRLEVNPINKGKVTVSGWDREQVQVRAFHSPQIRFEIQSSKNLVKVEERRPVRSALEDVRLEILVPQRFQVQVIGIMPQVSVEGVEGAVDVNTNQGDIAVRGCSGSVRLSSSGGVLRVEEASGVVQLRTSRNEIVVDGLRGNLEAETVNGDISLSGVASSRVKATSHRGSIRFQGALAAEGVYDLASDNGALELRLDEPLEASFTVGTVSGDFSCDFPLGGVEPKKGERFSFTVGKGGAQVDLLTFRGAIRILKR